MSEHKENFKKVLFSYLKSFGIVLGLIIIGIITSFLANKLFKIDIKIIKFIRLFSAAFIGTALFGRLGWNLQTWCGTTPPEKLNNNLYKILYSIGFFFLILSVTL